MPYCPTFPSPYMETIGKSSSSVFSCLINPRDTITEYTLYIYPEGSSTAICIVNGFVDSMDGVQKKIQYILNSSDTYDNKTLQKSLTETPLPICGSYNKDMYLDIEVDTSNLLSDSGNYSWQIVLYGDITTATSEVMTLYSVADVDKTLLCISGNKITQNTENIFYYGGSYVKYDIYTYKVTSFENYSGSSAYDRMYLYHPVQVQMAAKSSVEHITYASITSPNYFFKLVEAPTLECELTNTNSNSITATGVLTNCISDSYSYKLYDNEVLIYDTKPIYDKNVIFEYNGYISGHKYRIELEVCTTDGMKLSAQKSFIPDYEFASSVADVSISKNSYAGYINIDFSHNSVVDGKFVGQGVCEFKKFIESDGDIPESNNALGLNYGQTVTWDKVNDSSLVIPKNSTVAINWHGHKGFNGTIIELNDDSGTKNVTIGYNGSQFYYRINFASMHFVNLYSLVSSAIIHEGESTEIEDSTRYIIDDTDVLLDTDVIIENDLISKYWWTIVILPNEVRFVQGTIYEETVVE